MRRISEFLSLNEEQGRILEASGKVSVRAGAGSGKTRAIIARYIAILETAEADIPQIAAITFTENAAGELKSRIIREIAGYIDRYGHRGNIKDGWRRKISSAPIGTIHSFCSGILRENAFDSGFPLGFSVIEDSEKDSFYEQSVARFFLEKTKIADSRFMKLLELESYDYAQIVRTTSMILKEAARLHLVPPFFYFAGFAFSQEPDSARLEEMQDELHKEIENHISLLSSRSERKKTELGGLDERIDITLGIDGNIRHLRNLYGNIKDSVKTYQVEESRKSLLETLFSIMGHYDYKINSLYLDLSGEAYQFLVRRRIADEKIEYEDMIRFTMELFAGNPETLRYYRNFFRFIIVDEFQDTDSLQLELLEMLTGGDAGGSLIAVGDLNQSIYGFRGAQPEMFEGILRRKDFEKISFTTNYRSNGSLIRFFNAFFEGVFPKGYYDPMTLAPGETVSGEAVEVIVSEGASSSECAELEACAVASRIADLQRESCGKTAILFRSSSKVSVYENALAREGIRFQSRVGRDFYDLAEVRDVMSMLRYFLDPKDDLALASVLRSPYFGASDDELLSHFRDEPKKNGSRVSEYIRFLDGKREENVGADTFRVVDLAVNGLGYSSAVRALADGEARYLNLRKLLFVTERLISRKGCGLCQVVEHFDSMLREGAEECMFEETGDDVVRLMTVHGAKGLEFENVFICDTNSRKPTKSERVMADAEEGFIIRYPSSASDYWNDLKELIETREAFEEQRALYVAMTRAEKRLFVCLSGKRASKELRILVEKGSFAELIDSRLSQRKIPDDKRQGRESLAELIDPGLLLSSRCLGMPDGFVDQEMGIVFTGLVTRESEEPVRVRDTSPFSRKEISSDLKYFEPLYEGEEKPPRAGTSSLPDLFSPTDRLKDPQRTGSIMHRFLETWDFREETVEREIEFVLGEFLVSNPDMKNLLLELSSNFLSSELFPFISAAERVRRELKFVFDPEKGSTPKRGRIDILTEESGGVRLFDYKYRKSMDDEARSTYEEQMDGYCEAVRSRFEKPLLSRHIVLIPRVELVSI